MATIFNIDNLNDFSEKLNIDELYDKKKQYDLNQLNLFNKILNRIYIRIKNKSKIKYDEQFIWYLVPEIILGVPNYDHASCIAYLIDKLKLSGFYVKYYHPNLLFISWINWIPSYVRNEFKKKTGLTINEFGEKINEDIKQNENENIPRNPNDYLINYPQNSIDNKTKKKEYTPINSYKPSGDILYNDDLLSKIQDKFNK